MRTARGYQRHRTGKHRPAERDVSAAPSLKVAARPGW